MLENLIVYTAVLLAAVWLAHYLRRRARHAAARSAPREGTFLAGLGITAHLRDFYRLAVMLEGEGADFYLRLSEAALKPETRQLCVALAQQEMAHKKVFQSRLDHWHRLPPSLSDWPILLENARKAGFFDSPPPAAADERELARYALRQEELSVKFYESFEKAFPEAWRRERIAALAAEERAHAEHLRAAFHNL